MNLSKKRKLVYDVIQANPGVQNNDADLIAAVWRAEGWSDNRSLENNILTVTRSETITRRRRELHEAGLISYSENSLGDRLEAFRAELDSHSNAFDNILGNPMKQLDNLTVSRSPDDHSAVSWLAD